MLQVWLIISWVALMYSLTVLMLEMSRNQLQSDLKQTNKQTGLGILLKVIFVIDDRNINYIF